MPCLRISRRSLASTKWSDLTCCIGSSAKCRDTMMWLTSVAHCGINPLNEARAGLMRMPLSPEEEILCERLEKGEPTPGAAALIRQQAHEIDDLWDRLSHAYALVRRESPAEMIQEEMEALRAMLDERRSSQLKSPDALKLHPTR
jgi:hypothetical protein